MPTNLAIDDKLINEAKRLGNHKTKKSAVRGLSRIYPTQKTAGNN